MEPRMGIYVHIPYCASKCGYCDFYSRAGCESDMPRYQQALIAHIRECVPRIEPAYIDTVYFGGGTPSYYGARRIAQVLDEIKSSGLLMRNAEITVEANPDSLTRGEARILRRAGVNRLSIGMQSANNDILKMIGREPRPRAGAPSGAPELLRPQARAGHAHVRAQGFAPDPGRRSAGGHVSRRGRDARALQLPSV